MPSLAKTVLANDNNGKSLSTGAICLSPLVFGHMPIKICIILEGPSAPPRFSMRVR